MLHSARLQLPMENTFTCLNKIISHLFSDVKSVLPIYLKCGFYYMKGVVKWSDPKETEKNSNEMLLKT